MPGEIAGDIVILNIHLSDCVVRVSHVIGGGTNEIVTVTKQGAHRANLLGRREANKARWLQFKEQDNSYDYWERPCILRGGSPADIGLDC